jgi:hypothetical protein
MFNLFSVTIIAEVADLRKVSGPCMAPQKAVPLEVPLDQEDKSSFTDAATL